MQQLELEFLYEHPLHKEYGCDEEGNPYSMKNGKIRKLKPGLKKNGYMYFAISKDGKIVAQPFVHRFVWECIKGEIPDGYHVDHINFKRDDNRIENLQAMPASENIARRSEEGRRRIGEATAKSNKQRCSKPVLQYDKQYNLIAEFPSAHEAARQTGVRCSSISLSCNGKYRFAGGFKWKYKDIA